MEKIQVSLNRTRITGTTHEDLGTVLIISRSFHLGIRNVSDKSCRESKKKKIMFRNSPPPASENRAAYETMWKI